jgi:hypothetical protein
MLGRLRRVSSRVGSILCRPYALIALGGLIIATSIATMAAAGWWRAGLLVEGCWYLALIWGISTYRPFRFLGQVDVAQRAVLACFAFTLLAAQFAGGGRHTFPLVRWAMYTDPAPAAQAVVYEGLTGAGKSALLRPAALVPPLGRGRFGSKLRYAYDASQRTSSPGHTELDQLLRTLAVLYNRSNPASPIVAVLVVEYTVPVGVYWDRSLHRRRVLWRTGV